MYMGIVNMVMVVRILQKTVGHVDMCIRKKNHIGMVPNVRLVQVICTWRLMKHMVLITVMVTNVFVSNTYEYRLK